MIIIGITGTLGAGKGTVVEYLVKEKGFVHFSVRDYLSEVIRERGMDVNRDTMVVTANDLRNKNGPGFIIEELYGKAAATGQNCIIESIRTPGEIEKLRKKENFFLLAVDADIKIRYERIKMRGSETDNVSFETFQQNEAREMYSDDPNKQNLSECIRQADFILINDGSIEQLKLKTEEILKKIS
ncbi:MAG: AAA family ATPase [Bacteroidales bacterium]|nr:AAA family ATPase [Bacteroidales bacterium]